MKYLIRLSLLLLALLIPATASAYDFEVGGIYYLKNGNNASVTYQNYSNYTIVSDYSGNVTIPSTVSYNGTTYSVTSIGENAFFNCIGLTSVTIPNSVTSIGFCAFQGCSGLTSVTIPNSVTTIGDNAFYGCSGLTSVTIPNSVISIGDGALSACSSLAVITVESGNTTFDSRDNCNAIIETASNTLIAGCKATVIPSSVTSIGNSAFSGCSYMPSVIISNSVTSIGDYAFSGCSGLTSVIIPNSVSSIGGSAFSYCSSLTCLTIGNSVTYIGDAAFSGCSGLTSVIIPNSVTTIGNYAFCECSGLTSVTIGNSVTSIGDVAFYNCRGVTSVIVESGNPNYDSRDNCNAIIETSSNTLIVGCKATVIPNSVTSIGDRAFEYCIGLTSVDIPNSVTSIGDNAFFYCSYLTSVTIPNSVTSIGNYAFQYCLGLNDVFSFIEDPTTVSMGYGVFYICDATLHVPVGTVSAYQANTDWRNYFGSIVEIAEPLVPAEEIKLNVTTAGLNEGSSLQLMATVLPENSDKTVLWASNNPSVATVDSNGLVTTHGIGTATITAMTTDGSNLSTTCTVTLLPIGVKGDVNGDSKISISDVTALIDYLLSGHWPE